MKNNKMKLIGALLAMAVVTSCATVKPEVIEDNDDVLAVVGPDARIVQGVAKRALYSKDKSDSSLFEIEYSYFSTQYSSLVMDSSYKDSVNEILFEAVKFVTATQNEYQPITRHFFKAQLDSLADVFYEDEDEDDNPTLWDLNMSIGIQDYPSFVAVTLSGWSFLGGAHGNGYVVYRMIDREDGRELLVNDFFSDLGELNKTAEYYFRELHELSPKQSLNEYGFWFEDDKFTVNENFTFNEEGVTFYYNSYEIAPYSGGPTELFVPLDKIRHLLTQEL